MAAEPAKANADAATVVTSTCRVFLSGLLLLLVVFASDAWPQKLPGTSTPSNSPATTVQPEKDPYRRETPQGMVFGLMRALGSSDYERALHFFEVTSVSGADGQPALSGPNLAREFQQVLDRAGSVFSTDRLSENPTGTVDDGLPENVERFGMIKTSTGEVPLLATRVSRDGKSLWLVSEQTLSEIPALAKSVAGTPSLGAWIDMLPKGPSVFGAPLSHWLALLIAASLSYAVAWVLIALLGLVLRFVRRNGSDTTALRFLDLTTGPLRLLILVLILGSVAQALGISVVARYKVLFEVKVLGWFAVAWLLWRSSDLTVQIIFGKMSRQVHATAYSAVLFLNNLFKALLVLLFLALLLRALGINLTAGLAALGIGGLAVALGAQKLLENLIGSVTLIADHPVRVGDSCRFGDETGTVEEIGIRSTRIRTPDRTILTVPNGSLSSLHIENFSQRDRFWFHPTLNLHCKTTSRQMRSVLDALRSMLGAHPKVDHASTWVRLIGLGTKSIDIEISAYVFTRDRDDFLEIQEQLLLNCMDVVENSGTSFAFPLKTLYLNRDSAGDEMQMNTAGKTKRRHGDVNE